MSAKKECNVSNGGCGRTHEFVPSGDGGGNWKPIRVARTSGLCAACRQAIAEASCTFKRIEDCVAGDRLDMGVFAGIDARAKGQGPRTVNVRLASGNHYTESAGALVRVWHGKGGR